jgi:hypothetical protein
LSLVEKARFQSVLCFLKAQQNLITSVPFYSVFRKKTATGESSGRSCGIIPFASGGNMSSKELIHSINNQLTVVMGRAELLSRAPLNEESQRACTEIRAAAGNLHRLIHEYMHDSPSNTGS